MQITPYDFCFGIEIINDTERTIWYVILPFEKESLRSLYHLVVGYVANFFYVSTKLHELFSPAI